MGIPICLGKRNQYEWFKRKQFDLSKQGKWARKSLSRLTSPLGAKKNPKPDINTTLFIKIEIFI